MKSIISTYPAGVVLIGGLLLLGGCQSSESSQAGNNSGQSAMSAYVSGYQAYQNGDRDAAVRELLTAVDGDPQLITARAMLAEIYRQEGKYRQAAQQYEMLTALDPYDYLNFYHLGVSEHFLSQLRRAAQAYQKALALKPDDPKSNMNLGLAYMALGNSQDALPFAKKGVELTPDSAAAWGNYGLVLDANGNLADAEAAYRKSLDLDPSAAGVQVNYAGNLLRQNRPAEAVALLKPLNEKQPTSLSLRRLGDAYAAMGQSGEAVRQYQAVLKMNPRYYPAINAIADVRIGEYEKGLQINNAARAEAVSMWKRSLEINPNQPKVKALLERWEKADLFTPKPAGR